MRVILASASPRRQALLKNIFPHFLVVTTDADEAFVYDTPEDNVINVARNKVVTVNRDIEDLVIGADTTVYMDGKYYGKPMTNENAKAMLRELSGRTHTVYTGVCIAYNDKSIVFSESANVTFHDLSDEFIEDYVLSGSPLDKAGAYGVQDEGIVACYEGEYANIMGLPLIRLRKELEGIINGSKNSY
jgi:septum formation protein